VTFSGTWYAVHTYLLCGNSGTGTCQANMEVEPKVIVTDDESDCCVCEDSSKEDSSKAATIIQKCFRSWFMSVCYNEYKVKYPKRREEECKKSPCIHFKAATIIQKCFRGWYRFAGYKEYISYWERNKGEIYRRLMARFIIALKLQRQWRCNKDSTL